MDVETARAIMNEAKQAEWWLQDLPENPGELVNEAIYYAEEAKVAYDEGWGAKNEHIAAIVSLTQLAQKEPVSSQTNFGKEEPLGEHSSSERTQNGRSTQNNLIPSESEGSLTAPLVYLDKFPLPPIVDKPHLEIPRDITPCTDIHIRKLYSEYNSLMNRVQWELSVATADQNDALALREDAYRNAYLRAREDESVKKTTNLLDLEAKDDKEYQKYNSDVNKHNRNIIALKALYDIYEANVSRLSREMTFRQMDWEKMR